MRVNPHFSAGIFLLSLSTLSSCGLESRKIKVDTKMRTTGVVDLSLLASTNLANQPMPLASIIANSQLNIESYKVPIYRISLVNKLSGSGYSGTVGNIYECSGSEEECLVDLTQDISVDNLLKGGGSKEVEMKSDTEANGLAIEFCPDHAKGEGNTFNAYIKASGKLAETTYYSNLASNLSTSAPAEEVKIPLGCHGVTSKLLSAVSTKDGAKVNVVLYADPMGTVNLTSQKELINSNCIGEETLALCASWVTVFGTVDTETPTVERYKLDVTTVSTNEEPLEDFLLTLIINSSNEPFGATIQSLYANAIVTRNMHTPQVTLQEVAKNSSGNYDLKYSDNILISNFTRADSTGYTMSSLVDTAVEFDAKKL